MKYALFDEKMGKYLKESGYQKFDPYSFTSEMTQRILNFLIEATDPISELQAINSSQGQEPICNRSATKNSDKNLIILALLLSVFACALAIAALLSVRGLI